MAMELVATVNDDTRQRTLPEVEFGDVGHFMKLMHKIYDFFDEQTLIDVTFKVANPVNLVPAHRLVLSASSPYFVELFNSEKGLTPLIEFSDIKSETFGRLITYCYTGKMQLTIENIDKMLKGAILLKLDEAVTKCVDFLIENINEYTLERAYCLEEEAECTLLSDKIAEYEKNNFMEYNGTIFQYNKTDDSWIKWFAIKMDVNSLRVVPMGDSLIFIGGRRGHQPINEVKSWNLKTKTFNQMPPMNESRWLHCVALLHDEIYAIGGEGVNGKVLGSVEKYTETKGWKSVGSMITPRYNAGAVTLNGKIYLVGGCNENEHLKSVECYDPTKNCWSQCPNLNEARCNPGVTVHHGQIFAVGGYNKADLKTVERYDAQKCAWTKIGSLNSARSHIGTISIDHQVWAVGGFSKYYVSVYNEESGEWIEKNRMPLPGYYSCFSVPKALLRSE